MHSHLIYWVLCVTNAHTHTHTQPIMICRFQIAYFIWLLFHLCKFRLQEKKLNTVSSKRKCLVWLLTYFSRNKKRSCHILLTPSQLVIILLSKRVCLHCSSIETAACVSNILLQAGARSSRGLVIHLGCRDFYLFTEAGNHTFYYRGHFFIRFNTFFHI